MQSICGYCFIQYILTKLIIQISKKIHIKWMDLVDMEDLLKKYSDNEDNAVLQS